MLCRSLCHDLGGLASFDRGAGGTGHDRVTHIDCDVLEKGLFCPQQWRRARSSARELVESLISADAPAHCRDGDGHQYALTTHVGLFWEHREPLHVVLVDDTHLLRSMRKQYALLAERHNARFCIVELQAPSLEVCLQRRARDLPRRAIESSVSRFEVSRAAWWESNVLRVSNSASWTDLGRLCRHLPAPQLQSGVPQPQERPENARHRVEVSMRRAVAKFAQRDRSKGNEVNEAKRALSRTLDCDELVERAGSSEQLDEEVELLLLRRLRSAALPP